VQKQPKTSYSKNANQVMKEEDLHFFRLFAIIPDYLRLFATQPANIPSPKKQKQPKTSLTQNAISRLLLLSHNKKC
jgi:hypothetical protein